MYDHPLHVVAGILDPDSGDDPVLAAGSRIARAAGAVLHLVHAREEDDAAAPPAVPVDDGSQADARRHDRPGDAAEAILAVAREVRAGIVLLGPSRRGRLSGAILGTTAQRVLRASPAPVLVCRGDPYAERRRILLTTDLTAESRRIAATAARLLPLLGASPDSELRILLVGGDEVLLPPPVRRGPLREHSEQQLEAYLRREPLGGGLRAEPRVRLGLAGREIVEEAREWGADLVLVGTRGRTGGDRLLLGSVAESVVTGAPCDVLVIPPGGGGHDERGEVHPRPPDAAPG